MMFKTVMTGANITKYMASAKIKETRTANIDNISLVLQAARESLCEVCGLSTVLSYLSLVCQIHTGNTMLGLGKKSIPLL